MSSFTDELIIKYLNGRSFELVEPFKYYVGEELSNEVIIVPKGFKTDFASIPRVFWTIIGSPIGKYGKAAVIHDYLYYTKRYPRKRADQIFYEAMGVLKVDQWRRRSMFMAVRIAGWIPWVLTRFKKR